MLSVSIYNLRKAAINKNVLRAVILFFTGIFYTGSSWCQVINKVQDSFNNYQENNLQEKIYVHTNKTFYLTGEILWFKVYCVNGSNNRLLDISKVAYIDILDYNHKPVIQAKISLNGGIGNGSLFIPFSIVNGYYQLRSYTNWMKNFSPEYFFEKQITIVNPLKVSPAQVKVVRPAFDVQFFPEGGHLVNGLTSKVACKVTGTDGIGKAFTGAIVNQQNDTILHFSTLKFGIGSFLFTPQVNMAYKAVIAINNQVIVKELPAVSESGYVMLTEYNGEGWDVNIKNTTGGPSRTILLLVHNSHAIKIAFAATLNGGKAHFIINKDKLDDGLSYISLFDDQQRPLCERLIFKRPEKKLIINAKLNEAIFIPRKKVQLNIVGNDRHGQPLPADYSVSVFRAEALQNDESGHISSYLWLCAGIKGYIESPDYYMEHSDNEADRALDNLMLSQGWTQFDWSAALAQSPDKQKFLPEYTGHIISGEIINTMNREPAKNVIVYLTVPGTRQQLYTSKSDSAGHLLFNTQDFYGSNEIIAQTNTQIDSSYRIDISSPFSERYSNFKVPPYILSANPENIITDNSFNMQVQNIFERDQLKQFYAPQVDTVPFYGMPTKAYLLDSYTRFTTMEEVLREYVSGIAISKRRGKFNIRMFNGVKPIDGDPVVLLDGTPIFDIDNIFHIDPLKIRKLDVVSSQYLYGPVVFNGIMSFITYKHDMTGFEINPHAVILDYEALQSERKFYSPVYESDKQINSTIPDFRTALYWNPALITDRQGKNELSFYTSDSPGRYVGIIEGIALNGEAGSGYFTFEVKK